MDPALLEDPNGPLLGPWRGSAEALVEALGERPAVRWLRGSRMKTRAGLMDEWAAAAQFPPYFGGTWDALRDALSDLPEGALFLILEAEQLLEEAPPKEAQTLLAVLQAVREDLSPRPFRVICQAEPAHYEQLLRRLEGI